MEKMDEKREFSRIPAAAVVEMEPAEEHTAKDCLEVETLDMSSGGISFSTDKPFEPGTQWKLTLRLDESLTLNPDWKAEVDENEDFQTVSTLCEIVWTKGSEEIGYDVAARFVCIGEEDAAAVQKFLAEL